MSIINTFFGFIRIQFLLTLFASLFYNYFQGFMKPRLDLLRGDNRKLFYKPNNGKPAWFCLLAGIIIALTAAASYQYTGSPGFCSLCHSLERVHSQWQLSKHKQFACIECHIPAGNIKDKIMYKIIAGTDDLVNEVLRNYPAYITLSSHGREIMNANCLRCHFSTVENTKMVGASRNCSKCHRNLVHGKNLQEGGIKIE